MGWDFTQGATRSELIADLTRERVADGCEFRTLRKCFRGNTMYALHESGRTGELKRWICVYLLAKHGGYGWGYKAIEESMGPVEKNCPVSYLDEADEATTRDAKEWRAEVRQIAAERSSKKPKVGEVWSLRKGCTPQEIKISSLRPLRGVAHGSSFKLKKRLLVARVEV